jgi:DNA-directed RNA polymerase
LSYSASPADVYSEVAKKVEALLPEDSVWKGRVTRKVVKRNVMTTPYGVSRWGMRDQLHKELPNIFEDLDIHWKKTSLELVTAIDQAIRSTLVKAKELMDWYHDIADVILKKNLRLSWVTPDGFLVISNYPRVLKRRLRLLHRNVILFLYMEQKDHRQNPIQNRNAFAPNVTHSMDASHMTMVCEELQKIGVHSFCGVHDSFGVPPSYVSCLGDILRSTFIKLYESYCPMKAVTKMLPDEDIIKFPEKGGLDLRSSLSSAIYAFS